MEDLGVISIDSSKIDKWGLKLDTEFLKNKTKIVLKINELKMVRKRI